MDRLKDVGLFLLVFAGTLMLFTDFTPSNTKLTIGDIADQQRDFFLSKNFKENTKTYLPKKGEALKEIAKMKSYN
jgi:hypothetical protein